jgi:hypothetical protein
MSVAGNANLRYNPTLEDTRDEAVEVNLYSVFCQGIYEYSTVIVSATNSTTAQTNASDEYFRRINARPQSVVVTLIRANV